MQELPGCAPPGASAMRLTYSVELSPRLWVPVALLEGRIASALGENLEAIRDYVVAMTEAGARGEEMAKASRVQSGVVALDEHITVPRCATKLKRR